MYLSKILHIFSNLINESQKEFFPFQHTRNLSAKINSTMKNTAPLFILQGFPHCKASPKVIPTAINSCSPLPGETPTKCKTLRPKIIKSNSPIGRKSSRSLIICNYVTQGILKFPQKKRPGKPPNLLKKPYSSSDSVGNG